MADGKKNHHIVWKSTDGVNFTEVFSFDYHQNFISLEYRDGWFYLGVGYKAATKGYAYDSTADESGAIYRVRCPQEPIQVVPSVDSLELAEGASTTVSFRLSAQPSSNVTLRVGAALKNTRFTTDKSTLTFTTSDWNTPKSVTVSVDDNDVLDQNRSGAVVCGVAGFDVARGEFCGGEVTAGVINLTLGDSEFAPPANGEIRNADDFYCAMAFPDGAYKMMNDIDLTDSLFTTVPEFSGTLDGCGYTLSGLGDGPLATLNRGVIKNLTLDGTVGGKATEVKGIARGIFFDKMSGGAFTNCVLKGYTLKAGAPDTILGLWVAALTGPCEFVGCSTAADCTLSQNGSHDCSLGGFAGKIEIAGSDGVLAAFIDCTNNAAIAASDNYRTASGAGGFVGYVTGSASANQPEIRFVRSVNNGAITGKDRYSVLGGFVGRFNASNSNKSSTLADFSDCVNNASISHTGNGKSSGAAGGLAGIIGNAANAVFDRCVNRGDVIGPAQLSAGGLVGEFGNPSPVGENGIRIVNSANYGDIAATNNVGGLIGKTTGSTGTGWKNGHWMFLNSANYGALATTAVTVNGELAASVSCEATAATASITVSNCWTVTDRLFATTSRQPVCGGNYTSATAAATAAAALDAVAAKVDGYLGWTVGPTGNPELIEEQPYAPPEMTYRFYHEELNIPAMHAKGITGRGVRVGVVDDGIYPVVIGGVTNLGFAALKGSPAAGYHGTSVSALIGSKEFGLAPDCEIWAYNSGNATGKTGLDQTIAGVWWCATNGCRVINMSFGFAPDMYDADLRAAFDAELAEIQRQTGVILINGNGNNPLSDINYCPQESECVITIGGLKPDKTPAALTDSWRKDFCTFGDQVPDFVKPDGTIGTFDGTSCACPLATAIVALLLQQQPDLTQDEVYGILKSSAKVLAPGRTREYGWGLLQACEVPANYKRQAEYDAEKQAWVKLENVTITNKFVTYTASDNFYEITMRTGSVIRLMLSDPMPANATDKTVYWYCGNNHAGRPILTDQILRAPDEIATVTEITIGGQTIKLPTPNLENVYSYQGLNANYELLFNLRVRLTTDPVEIPENEDPNYVPADPVDPEDPPSGDPSVVYVAVTGSDSAAGTHAAPLLTISNAVARLGAAGGTVMVGPGEYKIYDPIVITTPVNVVGSGCGNGGTVVKNVSTYNYNKHANCRIMEVSNAVAIVQGLVMENGFVGMGTGMNHGGGVMLTSGTVSNCVIRGCKAHQGSTAMPYGGGAYVFGAHSLLTHCVISNCISDFDANWGSVCGAGVHVDGGKVSNVLVVDCHGDIAEPGFAKIVGGIMLTDGTAENCTVVNCWGSKAGGICASPAKNKTVSVVNCVAFGCEKKLKDAEKVLQTTSSNGDGTESCFVNCSFSATAAAFADYANGDYRPAAGGVLVDAGAAIAAAPAGDLDGRPRVVGTAIDIGCFEWQEGGVVELETPVLSGSSFGFSWTGKFSIVVENPVRGAYYTVFTTEDLRGTFIAESASVLCDGEALVLEMDASAPQKFAKVVISSSPFVKGSELP